MLLIIQQHAAWKQLPDNKHCNKLTFQKLIFDLLKPLE